MNSEPAAGAWPVTLRRHPRARRMRLRLDPRSRTVLLTIPPRASERRALAWAEQQRPWIEAAVADLAPEMPLRPGSVIPYQGRDHVIRWQEGAPRTVKLEDGAIVTGGPLELVAGRLLRWLRGQAATLLERETREFASLAGVAVTRVGIGDPVTRWGSCSAGGTIRYSWRLVLAPDWVRRATVAHEVAHRVHMNHGTKFHALVADLLGADPAPARQWLRRNGVSLHRFGRS